MHNVRSGDLGFHQINNHNMTSYEIDSTPLVRLSRPPKYVKQRRLSTPNYDVSARHDAILLARRTKLKARIAHVTQVMLNHRESLLLNSRYQLTKLSTNLTTAAKARQKRLDGRTLGYRMHIDRAKAIALKHRENIQKKQAELLRLLNERTSMTTTRRLSILSTNSRSRSRTRGVSDNVKNEKAVVIQRWYRMCKFKPISHIWQRIGISRIKSEGMSYGTLSGRIQVATIVKAATFLIVRAKRVSGLGSVKNGARMLLSSFMLLRFRSEMMTLKDGQEDDLVELVEKMVTLLDDWVRCSRSDIQRLGTSFYHSFLEYCEAFQAWKSRDTQKIIDILVNNILELDQVWLSVMSDSGGPDWRLVITEQQEQHLVRLKRFEGGLDSLSLRRRAFVMEMGGECEGLEMDGVCTLIYHPIVESPLISTNPSPLNSPSVTHSKPPRRSENDQLAHRILIDSDFKVSKRVKVEDSFRKTLKAELDRKEYGLLVFSFLKEMGEGLLEMSKGSLRDEIETVFDFEFIHQQISKGVFQLENMLKFIGEKMLRLCSPVRDVEIRALLGLELGLVVTEMSRLMHVMKMDLTQFHLEMVKGEMESNLKENEKKRVNEMIANGVVLHKTKVWLDESRAILTRVDSERKVLHHTLLNDAIVNHAVLKTLFTPISVSPENLPESLEEDCKTLFSIQNDIQAITLVISLLILTSNIDTSLKNHCVELSESLFTILAGEPTLKIISDLILQRCDTSDHKDMIRGIISKTVSNQDAFLLIILRRLERVLKAGMEGRKVELGCGFMDVVVKGRVEKLNSVVSKLVEINKAVYGTHYDALLAL